MARIRFTTASAAAAERMIQQVREQSKAFEPMMAAAQQLADAAYADPDGSTAQLQRYLSGEGVERPLMYVEALVRRAKEGDVQRAVELEKLTAQFADNHDHLTLAAALVTGWAGLPRIAYARAGSSPGAAEICALMEIVVPGVDARCPDWLARLLRNDAGNPAPWACLSEIAEIDPRYRDMRYLSRTKKLQKRLARRGN